MLPTPLGVYQLVDQQVTALVLSEGFCRLFGYEDSERACHDMNYDMYGAIHPDDAARVANETLRFIKKGGRYEAVYRTKRCTGSDYHIIHVIGEHGMTADGVRLAFFWYTDEGVYREGDDRSERSLNLLLSNALHEESIIKAGYYDDLTGLPSMTYFFELADAGKQKILQEGGWPSLLYMDLSGMKYYNSRYGFAEGNKLIRDFSRLLAREFGSNRCSHFGADHFVVLTEKKGLEETLQELFAQCTELNGGQSLPVRVGIYNARLEHVSASTACDRAKMACDALRGSYSSGTYYYSQELQDAQMRRQKIRENLDQAIREEWIEVYYQAIIRAVDGKVCNEEALSRWDDPVDGFLSPADFIPALEEARLIYKLDLYVVERVLEKMKLQAQSGMYVVPQSVNLSRTDFECCDIVEEIRRRVDEAGIDRSMLVIEITESIIGRDFDFMKEQILRFRELGFRVWMDDFGSGYSSLDVLQEIPFDLIKFDMRFMQRFDSGEEGKIILTELTKMAIGLGIETVCEGVECREQVDFLREIGCTKIQGFYYGRPIPFREILALYHSGVDMGFENPEESSYYAVIGSIDLYDMSVLTDKDDDTLRHYFNAIPMAILEVTGEQIHYTRCNQSYRDFMKRLFDVTLTGEARVLNSSYRSNRYRGDLLEAIIRASREGIRLFVDERIDQAAVHLFVRRVAVNPVTGTAAVAIAVLGIEEKPDG